MPIPSRLWIFIASLTLMVVSPLSYPPYLIEAQEKHLEMSLVPSQIEIVAGNVTQWNLKVLNPNSITLTEINILDEVSWAWAEQPPSQISIANTQDTIFELSVIPLIPGTLQPGIQITYQCGDQLHHQIVLADSVQVVSTTSLVFTEIILDQKTIQVMDIFTAGLWLKNQTPFTLTQVSIGGAGIDIEWFSATPVDIVPEQSYLLPMMGKITGSHPQPQFLLHYQWVDATGSVHEYSGYVLGNTLEVNQPKLTFWRSLPSELYATLLGLAIGVITTSVNYWLKDSLDRRFRAQHNRSKVLGMLKMLVLQAEQAAEKGASFNVGVVETIFQNDELYGAMDKLGVSQSVRDLWKAAQLHNQNMERPSGAQRSEKLSAAANALGGLIYKFEKTVQNERKDISSLFRRKKKSSDN